MSGKEKEDVFRPGGGSCLFLDQGIRDQFQIAHGSGNRGFFLYRMIGFTRLLQAEAVEVSIKKKKEEKTKSRLIRIDCSLAPKMMMMIEWCQLVGRIFWEVEAVKRE